MLPNPTFGQSRPLIYPPGTLRVYPLGAQIISDCGVKGKPKVFCKVRLDLGIQETLPDKDNGFSPIWNQELAFRRHKETLMKFQLYHKNLISSHVFMGEALLDLNEVFQTTSYTGQKNLTKENVIVGTIDIRIRWEPDLLPQPTFQKPMTFFIPPQTKGGPTMDSAKPTQLGPSMTMGPSVMQPMMMQIPGPGPQMGFQPQPQIIMMPPGHSGVTLQLGSSMQMQSQPMMIGPIRFNMVPSQQGMVMGGAMKAMQKPEEKKDIEEPVIADLPEDQKCIICLEKKKSVAFYKCGHNCCCYNCGKKFIGKNCPICRQDIIDIIKVYEV